MRDRGAELDAHTHTYTQSPTAVMPLCVRTHACSAQYSAERMSLVVLGGEPLGVLQSWVAEAFQGLPTGKGPRPAFTDMPRPFKVRCVCPCVCVCVCVCV